MNRVMPVETPDSPELDQLCERIAESVSGENSVAAWPSETLRLCGQAGVYRWFLGAEVGGYGWSDRDQTRGYLRLAQADLNTTFVITQYMGAIRRIAGSENRAVADRWLEPLVSGSSFATVGISHLTTSSRHLGKPALQSEPTESGFLLNGLSPWVTGVPHGDLYVVGATLDDGREILAAVERETEGVRPGPGAALVSLTASCTDRLEFDNVHVDQEMILAGPIENVMRTGVGAGTGGLQTSTLAIGLSKAAMHFLQQEASRRDDLRMAVSQLDADVRQLEETLLRAAAGDAACDASNIRGNANRLVLRTTQAALTAAKGAGFLEGHAVGRWCREALFFLVWSCPQPVAQAHLCELAGIDS